MTRYELFDRKSVRLKSISKRGHALHIRECQELASPTSPYDHPRFVDLIQRIAVARANGRPVILMMGAHPIKLGLSRFLIDLFERGLVTHLATNGAGLIHDFELALVGGTSEDVAKWIQCGQFGLWSETSQLNDIVADAHHRNEGLGEAIGRAIEERRLPHRQLSVAAAGWRLRVPVTGHVGMGCDIIHAHPNFDGAAYGAASDIDFLILAKAISNLEGGVYLNVGTAVTGPEVFLKALSMARNLAATQGEVIGRFTVAVFDLLPIPDTAIRAVPSPDTPEYYFRPWKNLLVRTVADIGSSFYFCADHRQTIPSLWHCLVSQDIGSSRPSIRTDDPASPVAGPRRRPAVNTETIDG